MKPQWCLRCVWHQTPVKHSALCCVGSVCQGSPWVYLSHNYQSCDRSHLAMKQLLWDISPNFSLPCCCLSNIWKVTECLLQWPSGNLRQVWLTSFMLVSSGSVEPLVELGHHPRSCGAMPTPLCAPSEIG